MITAQTITKNSSYRPLIGIPTWNDYSVAYNDVPLYGINQSYVNTIASFGGIPILIPLNLKSRDLRILFGRLDGLFLSGGTDISPRYYGESYTGTEGRLDTDRDRTELMLARWALDKGLPVFGVCRGMQILNVASGGTLYHDLATDRPDVNKHDFSGSGIERKLIRHSVETAPNSYLGRVLGDTADVNSMHHQAIKRVGFGFCITAHSDDHLPEGIEAQDHPFAVGVQWHPEELTGNPRQAQLFQDFIAAAITETMPLAV